MTPNWPPTVWLALNQLAELDLAHYSGHVFDRPAFLDTARTKRVRQHSDTIDRLLAADPQATAERILAACNPRPESVRPEPVIVRREFDDRPKCARCDRIGFEPVVQDGVERWMPCPECHPLGRKTA